MASLYLGVLGITAFACGVTVPQLIAVSGFAVFTVLALITLLYVFMMGGIAGRTIGSMLLEVPLMEHPSAPLNLRAILRRSLRFVRADAAAAAEVVVAGGAAVQPPAARRVARPPTFFSASRTLSGLRRARVLVHVARHFGRRRSTRAAAAPSRSPCG